MEQVKIQTEFIKLDQFLKWAGAVGSGAEAKLLIIGGYVKVNGAIEIQRGKKIRVGDKIEYNELVFEVI